MVCAGSDQGHKIPGCSQILVGQTVSNLGKSDANHWGLKFCFLISDKLLLFKMRVDWDRKLRPIYIFTPVKLGADGRNVRDKISSQRKTQPLVYF